MATEIPLSVSNIKKLAKQLQRAADTIGGEAFSENIEMEVGALIADDVRANIAGIPDVDGNYMGTDNPNASVLLQRAPGYHTVAWTGKQIAYVEFGTGATGAAGSYPGPAMGLAGYHPDPTKDSWWYKDAKIGPWVSLGLAPQAPMYNAAMLARTGRVLPVMAGRALKQVIDRALTV